MVRRRRRAGVARVSCRRPRSFRRPGGPSARFEGRGVSVRRVGAARRASRRSRPSSRRSRRGRVFLQDGGRGRGARRRSPAPSARRRRGPLMRRVFRRRRLLSHAETVPAADSRAAPRIGPSTTGFSRARPRDNRRPRTCGGPSRRDAFRCSSVRTRATPAVRRCKNLSPNGSARPRVPARGSPDARTSPNCRQRGRPVVRGAQKKKALGSGPANARPLPVPRVVLVPPRVVVLRLVREAALRLGSARRSGVVRARLAHRFEHFAFARAFEHRRHLRGGERQRRGRAPRRAAAHGFSRGCALAAAARRRNPLRERGSPFRR